MSLLIKALDKAQEKAQDAKVKQEQTKKTQAKRSKVLKAELAIADADSELSLSPPEAPLLEDAGFEPDLIPASIRGTAAAKLQEEQAQKEIPIKTIEKPTEKYVVKPIQQGARQATNYTTGKVASQTSGATPTQAANVFNAKQLDATHQNTKLAVIAGAGLIAMLAMGAYYYQFVDSTPDVPMPPIRPPHIVAVPPAAEPMPPVVSALPESQPIPEIEATQEPDTTQAFEPREQAEITQKQKNKTNAQPQNNDETIENVDRVNVENTLDTNEALASSSKNDAKSNSVKFDKAIASDSASIQVSQSKPQDAINPTLIRAYEAYNTGSLSDAQKLYKQVLQRDSSNIDAMLGLGAIATSQGRTADASSWYRKVLGIEPRNSTAQAALLDLQQQDDPQIEERRIKSMLAKSPNDASLHATLGNFYAEQNQWPAAQQSYFDAYRLNASADNAFNLGVSLDQMGKPKLALPYYQEALQLAQQSSASGIDKAALEARIASIQ